MFVEYVAKLEFAKGHAMIVFVVSDRVVVRFKDLVGLFDRCNSVYQEFEVWYHITIFKESLLKHLDAAERIETSDIAFKQTAAGDLILSRISEPVAETEVIAKEYVGSDQDEEETFITHLGPDLPIVHREVIFGGCVL